MGIFFLKEKKRKPALGSRHSNNRQESSMDVKLQGMGYLHRLNVPPTNYLLITYNKGENNRQSRNLAKTISIND